MNTKMIRYITGSVLMMEAGFLLIPAITALIYRESCVVSFLGTALFCLVAGQLIRGFKKPTNTKITVAAGYTSVACCWIALSIGGAIALYATGYFPNPIDAIFEIVSGFTTTGASILSDVEAMPHGVLMWRSFSHWIGGMGILVFMLAILPMVGGSSVNLMKAESPGPSVGKLVPKVKSTARLLYLFYILLTVAEGIILMLVGCPIFDSINLAFATAGTGGFGVLNSSVADYNAATQWVITIFMVLFGVNFNIYYLFFMKRIREGLRSEELRVYFGIVLVTTTVIAINIYHTVQSVGLSIRQAAFQVAAIITTTGFSTADFDLWPELSKTILVCLMFIGACAGSTGGGIKVSRVWILFKSVGEKLSNILHPRNVQKIRFEGKPVEDMLLRSINAFITIYILIYMASMLVISLDNFDFTTNFTAVAAAINNIGPGLSGVGPSQNFAAFSNLSKLVLCLDMLAGRLEIFPMIVPIALILKREKAHISRHKAARNRDDWM